jgi:hypothetical protein
VVSHSIFKSFPLTDPEYQKLEEHFGDLCRFEAWQLRRKNVKNNPGVDVDDFVQELRMSLLSAGSYYKRQKYIEASLKLARKYVVDEFTKNVVEELANLWANRKRHGANRQKYGPHQERLLANIVRRFVPRHMWPKKNKPLEMDKDFTGYCKSITWNKQKALGRKISKERELRSGLVSLSEFDCFAGDVL